MILRTKGKFPLLLYTIAVIVLLVLGMSAYYQIRKPDFGFHWSYGTGVVFSVIDPAVEAVGITVGSRIVTIDGLSVKEARGLPGRLPGQTILVELEQGRQTKTVPVVVVTPSFVSIITRLIVVIAAFSFWILGLSAIVFGMVRLPVTLFFLATQMIAAILATGAISSYTPVAVGWIFVLLFWSISPVLLHLHFQLFGGTSRRLNRLITISYISTFFLALADIILTSSQQGQFIQSFQFVWFIAHLVGVVASTLQVFFRKHPLQMRRTAALVSLSVFLGFMPLILFSMLPELLTGSPFVSYDISLLSLSITPGGYTYAILRHRLLRYDRYINRSAALFLSMLLVATVYIFVYSLTQNHSMIDGNFQPIFLFLVPLLLTFLVHPLFRLTQAMVNNIFYGEWFDDIAIVKHVSRSIENPSIGIQHLGKNLCQTLVTTLGLEAARLVLRDGEIVSNRTGGAAPISEKDILTIPKNDFELLCEELVQKTGREMGQLSGTPDLNSIETVPQRKMLFERSKSWFLLKSGSGILGLLILGGKRGGGDYSSKDLEILEVSLMQAKAILENAYLIEELEFQAENIKKLHMELMLTREEERKRIARDLHDQTIQALIGINYQMEQVRSTKGGADEEQMGQFQQEVKKMLDEVRQICSALRPPALDSVGLAPAIQSRIEEFSKTHEIEIHFVLNGNDDDGFSERAMFCLFRVFQEAMTNTIKHANAKNASVSLNYKEDCVYLVVEDDGRGFEVPKNIDRLIRQSHFGLIGIKEMVEILGGKLDIDSSPGAGCKVVAQVPFDAL